MLALLKIAAVLFLAEKHRDKDGRRSEATVVLCHPVRRHYSVALVATCMYSTTPVYNTQQSNEASFPVFHKCICDFEEHRIFLRTR